MDPLAEIYSSYYPYAYVENNPVSFIDPTGLEPVLDGIAGRSYDVSGGYNLMGGYSRPIDGRTGKMITNGVHKFSLGLGTGFRVGTSFTKKLW